MKTTTLGHDGKSSNNKTFKDLLRRKSLMERLAPVLGELLWMVQGCKNPSRRKKALPDYCYKILQALQKTHFKALPAADSLGQSPENLNWDALGRVVGAGLRCLRQEAANSDFLLERGAAAEVNSVDDLPFRLGQLLGSKKLAVMSRSAKALGRPAAAAEICRAVAELLKRRPVT